MISVIYMFVMMFIGKNNGDNILNKIPMRFFV